MRISFIDYDLPFSQSFGDKRGIQGIQKILADYTKLIQIKTCHSLMSEALKLAQSYNKN